MSDAVAMVWTVLVVGGGRPINLSSLLCRSVPASLVELVGTFPYLIFLVFLQSRDRVVVLWLRQIGAGPGSDARIVPN